MNSQDAKPSKLMLDECFIAADERFLDEFVKFNSRELLLSFVERWLSDERPWAKFQIRNYLRRDLNFPGQEVVVKRFFKHFEAVRDHVMMAEFMVCLDRLVRRSRVSRSWWNRETRETIVDEVLFARPNKTVPDQTGRTIEYGTGRGKRTLPLPDIRNKPKNRLFKHRTRNYLRRRVWRYFRWLSYRDPEAYLNSVCSALTVYQDDDFSVGENIIDNWSLMHACFGESDVISFNAAHTNLVRGRSLGELNAAPYRGKLWSLPTSAGLLIQLLTQAQSSLVRVWAMELLQRHHAEAIRQIEVQSLMIMLSHSDVRIQEFAADLFRHHTGLGTLSLATWLDLLKKSDARQLSLICEAMTANVTESRLTTAQLIELTCARPTPVAELGFRMLQSRHSTQPLNVDELTRLSGAECESVAATLTTWTLSELNSDGSYSANSVVEFFDSLLEPMRSAAMEWLELSVSRGYNDPVLWSKLVETPFDDVRIRIVECLQRRTLQPQLESDAMAPLWCSVILGVHRGGRAKLKAVAQIQDAILGRQKRASGLLPVLAVAVRSLRAPERRAALCAVATMMVNRPQLRSELQSYLPELEWIDLPQGQMESSASSH